MGGWTNGLPYQLALGTAGCPLYIYKAPSSDRKHDASKSQFPNSDTNWCVDIRRIILVFTRAGCKYEISTQYTFARVCCKQFALSKHTLFITYLSFTVLQTTLRSYPYNLHKPRIKTSTSHSDTLYMTPYIYVGRNKSYVRDSKSYVRDYKSYVRDNKSYIRDNKSYVRDNKSYV